ncbi:MFS transporter small subunit [Tautonia plasticadhaerens]|uniref:Oxalate:formate antiporter n=1 Tax=Tautonia plasticadhaerens TaxID=2527974 RepID=A0A518GZJ5_9BACT|nr:hypothetical protein [Tautonia plasticadhaerens]QDV33992.1 hypothetical protein ElP_18730 [Tautonia plasticadhaerens]
MARDDAKTSPLVLALSWMVVLIPLGWGVVQSVAKSLPLFAGETAPAEALPDDDNEGRAGERSIAVDDRPGVTATP